MEEVYPSHLERGRYLKFEIISKEVYDLKDKMTDQWQNPLEKNWIVMILLYQ